MEMKNCGRIEDDLSIDAKITLSILKSDKSVEEKLKLFKQFIQKSKNEKSSQLSKDLISFYFLLESKHPVKSVIQSHLNHTNDSKQESIEIFTKLLMTHIEELKNDNIEAGGCYGFINYLNELSQNFEIAFIAVGQSSREILPLLNGIIKNYLNQLNGQLSASIKREYSHRFHNCFQAYMFCVKCTMQQTQNQSDFVKHIEDLIKICSGIYECNEIGIETKNIFSMLTVLRNNLIEKNDHMIVIEDGNENNDKRLCLMSGVIQITNTECINTIEKFCIILQEIFINNTFENAIVYTVSRLLMQLIKKFASFETLEYSEQVVSITRIVNSISFLNLEHNVESVRYLSREALKTLIELAKRIPEGERINEEIFNKISSSSIDLKAAFISAVHSVLSVVEILEKLPDTLDLLLSTIKINKENKINCYLILSNKGCSELEFSEWFEIFVTSIAINIKKSEKIPEEKSLLINLLLKCIKKDKRAILELMESKGVSDVRFNFMLFNLAKEESLLKDDSSEENLWRGVISYDEIKQAMIDIDIDIRLSALHLVVDTKKVTNEFSDAEVECLLYYFENNINLQISSTKQAIIGMIKKIFARFSSAAQNLTRKNDSIQLENLLRILEKFHKFSISNLHGDANYFRRNLSLVLLYNVHEVMKQHYSHHNESMWTKNDFDTLFNVFYDSYEHNKEKALELMVFVPMDLIKVSSKITLEYLEKLHKSIKPADSLTASYLILFGLKFSVISFEQTLFNDEQDYFNLMLWCESQLSNAIEKAEKSIIVAAGSNPMYGFISSIRIIINQLNLNDVLAHHKWREFFNRLISILKRLSRVAEPIVNNPSPEGIYPKENIHLLINDDNEEDILRIVQNTTSQMILLCAWRIIREVSLLLGDLSTKASPICGTANELYTSSQLVDIGDHFLKLLTNIKHRGAFEQCFLGFSQYCAALKTCHCYDLHNLPSKILHNILDSISNRDNIEDKNLNRMKNLCATRRSAGLPFIIQSILSSEVKLSKFKNFHHTMKNLLHCAQFGNDLETRIHSLNISRVIYRCKELNDVINEYICDGIKCSILGCGAETWAERNSSTLLFSSIMIRTFGVQRNKDSEQIDIKNKMSSKIFFLRYPELYDFFMEQLSQSVDYVKSQQMNPKLYPLLLILNRLFTSPSENCESNLKLVNFIPLVTACSGCVDLKARILCAKFVASVNPMNRAISRISYNIKILRECGDLSANIKHGRLLEIYHLVRNSVNHQKEILIKILHDLLDVLKEFKNEIICFTTILDTIIHIFKLLWNEDFKDMVNRDKLKLCFDFNKSVYFGVSAIQAQLAMVLLIQMELEMIPHLLISFNSNQSFYELLQKLNCITLILNDVEKRDRIIEEYEIDKRIHFFIANLSSDVYSKLMNEIHQSEKLFNEITKLTKHEDLTVQARSYEILSLLKTREKFNYENINNLLDESLTRPDEFKIAILNYTKNYLQKNEESINVINWKTISELVNSSYWVQLAVIDFLKIAGRILSTASLETSFYFSVILIKMLMDDDIDICGKASGIVSDIVKIDKVFIGSHAASLFVNFLIDKMEALSRDERILLVLALLFKEEILNNESQDEEPNDFQIFEKSDSNSIREWFIVRNLMKTIIKRGTFKFENCEEMALKLFGFFKSTIKEQTEYEELLKFVQELNLF